MIRGKFIVRCFCKSGPDNLPFYPADDDHQNPMLSTEEKFKQVRMNCQKVVNSSGNEGKHNINVNKIAQQAL